MKKLMVLLGAAMFAGLFARGEVCCGEINNYICWGSFYRDVFVCGWNHVPSPDEMPGVGYSDPGCRMLFTELVECEDVGEEWMDSPCGDYYTVYRDDVAIATGLTGTGYYQWFTDCDVELGRTYKYEIVTARGTTGPTNATCVAVYRANIGTNEVVFSADEGSRKIGIAIYLDRINPSSSTYDPYAIFFVSGAPEWVAADKAYDPAAPLRYNSFTVWVDENTNNVPRECVLAIEYEGFKWPVKVRQEAKAPEGDTTVAFDGNGGAVPVPSAAFMAGQRYGSLPTASRDGYRFAGWSTLADAGLLIDENSIVSEETETLYAVWKSEAEPIWTIEAGVLKAVELNGATDIEIPGIVTSIGTNVFEECSELKSVVIPGNVAAIGGYAFFNCNLERILFANGLVDIGEFAFGSCDQLHGVTFPNTLKTVGTRAFYNCAGLTCIDIPASLKDIAQEAFAGCTKLNSLALPDTLESIGSSAFRYCRMLTSITIPAGVTRIETGAFSDCSGLYSVTYLGACPETGTCIYASTPEDLVSIVPAVGWEDALAEDTWQGRRICADRIKVTFGKNGGTGGDNYVTAMYGKAMPTPRTAPKLSGWAFAGYWDSVAIDEKGNPKGKQYYDGSMKSVRAWDKTAATTLWAKWTNKVTFGKNGGTGGDSYVTCTKGQPMPKRTMPTKTGYTFAGYWTTTGAGGVKYYNADGTSAHAWDKAGNVTLWAKWEKAVSVKVTFGKNGGTGGDNYVTATTGKPMPAPRTAPKKSGWTFGGYWDTLACDAKGNPLGKQYYNAKMESVRNWDRTSAVTLWAKWTVRVTLGKNGGTGGDSYVTVTYNQPFPTRAMPTKSGYKFGGYFVSASSKTGQCYNADGTGTSTMKWATGGTPTIWALWNKTGSCVEQPAAASAAPVAATGVVAIPAGLYSGVLADGSGSFWLTLDEPVDGFDRTAYLYVASDGGVLEAECTVEETGGLLILTTEDGETLAVDPVAGTASRS